MDELRPGRVVKAGAARPLKREEAADPALDAFLKQNANMGLLVLKGDAILAERYQYGRTEKHRFASASVAKTVLGMLVGIALQEGRIASLDDKASRYVAGLRDHPYGEVTLRQLLTMSSGMAFDDEKLFRNKMRGGSAGGAAAVTEFNRRDVPAGTRFRYSSVDSEVLGLALRGAVGRPLADYLAEKIWQPMGAEADASWLIDSAGFEAGYCCINATLRDFARFGLLLADFGKVGGRQVIPEQWVRAATTAEAPHLRVGTATPNNGYGYQTWLTSRTEPRFAALGFRGQAIFVDPATRLVVVHAAAWEDGSDRAARRRQFQLWQSLLDKHAQ